jgi:hypothetical protein
MDGSDTLNALAALGIFLTAGAGAVVGRVSSKRSGNQSTESVDDTDRTLSQTETRAEIPDRPALELRIRQIGRSDEYELRVVTRATDEDSAGG